MTGADLIYLSGISYELGQLCPVSNIRSDEEPAGAVDLLQDKGVKTYSRFEEMPTWDVIRRCIATSLRAAGIGADEVDAVFLVTESFSEVLEAPIHRGETEFRGRRNGLFDAIAALGITNAAFFCSTYGGSTNFLQSLYLAKPLVEAGKVLNVLLLCADRHPPGLSRFMAESIAMTGDGIATCVITREPKPNTAPCEIEHVGVTSYRLPDRQEAFGRLVLEMYRATKSAAADCYEAVGRQPAAFRWLILNNYNELTCKVFSQLLGFSLERTFLRNVSRTGHIPACDALINVKDLSSTSSLQKGDSLFLFANGPVSCGAISLVQR